MPTVYIPLPVEDIEESQETSSLTYALDLDKGRISGRVDGLEAVNQAIRKALITPRFKCLIYDNQYGSEIEDAVASHDATREYIETAVEGFIVNALKPDTRILKIYDFTFSFQEECAYITFRADTIFGETTVEEVIADV